MEADAAGGVADASPDFEELGAQRFDLRRAPRLRQVLAKQVDQIVGEAIQQQAEGVGQKAMAAQAVGAKTVLEFLDAVLALAAIVVEGEDLRRATGAVGHHETQVGASGGVFGFVADAALTRPGAGTMTEASHHLFGLPAERIEILVHPQSVVHSLVAYVDGSVLAHLGSPDMRTPIAYALGWPRRMHAPAARLDLVKLGQLSFEAPDFARFPSLRLAQEALRAGGTATTVLNAANEVAVQAFLDSAIGFGAIARTVETVLSAMSFTEADSLEAVAAADATAREMALRLI